MTAKEYLSQTRYLDDSINTKIELLDGLNALATKCTSVLSDMPRGGNGSTSRLEETVVKIISLQEVINAEIDAFVDTKAEIRKVIMQVEDKTERLLLEKRYLCCMAWEDIESQLFISKPTSLRLHRSALDSVEKILASSKVDT